jgi:hypothetical protein
MPLPGHGTFSIGESQMTFKYSFTLEAHGANKLRRFKEWMKANLPDLQYSPPPQTPIDSTTLTIRLRSLEDGERIRKAMGGPLP